MGGSVSRISILHSPSGWLTAQGTGHRGSDHPDHLLPVATQLNQYTEYILLYPRHRVLVQVDFPPRLPRTTGPISRANCRKPRQPRPPSLVMSGSGHLGFAPLPRPTIQATDATRSNFWPAGLASLVPMARPYSDRQSLEKPLSLAYSPRLLFLRGQRESRHHMLSTMVNKHLPARSEHLCKFIAMGTTAPRPGQAGCV